MFALHAAFIFKATCSIWYVCSSNDLQKHCPCHHNTITK